MRRRHFITLLGGAAAVYRGDPVIALAVQQRSPVVYSGRGFVAEGGLISYASGLPDLFWRAAGYVDRILQGRKPGDLPVQVPTKFEMVINLKTASWTSLSRSRRTCSSPPEAIE